jgi:membrane-associated PAP2 superfamily phosphatase
MRDLSDNIAKRVLLLLLLLLLLLILLVGHAVAQLVEALCYKPEGRGSIPDEVIGSFN